MDIELDHYILGLIFTSVALITLVTIIIGSRWPANKEKDENDL